MSNSEPERSNKFLYFMQSSAFLVCTASALLTILLLMYLYPRPKSDSSIVTDDMALSQKEIKILLWGSTMDNPAMKFFQEACNDFMKHQPTVTIEIEYYSVEQYKNRLPVLMAANQTPDIFMTWCGAFLDNFVKSNKIASLNQFVSNANDWKASFSQHAFDHLTYNGHIYGVPTSRVLALLFYNKKILDGINSSPPTNHSDLIDTANILKSEGIIPIAFGNKEPWIGGMLAGLLIERLAGKDLLTEIKQGKATWTHPAIIETGQIIQQWINQGVFPDNPNTIDYQSTIGLFHEEKAAMMVMGSWYLQYYLNKISEPEFDLGLTAFPGFSAPPNEKLTLMGQTDMNLAIGAQSKVKDTAFQLIQWITSEKYQRKLLTEVGLIPAVNVSIKHDELPIETYSILKLLKKSESFFIFPDIGLGRPTGQEFNKSIQRIIAGDDIISALRLIH